MNTPVYHYLYPPIHAKYLRFHPKTWYSHICMRVEVYVYVLPLAHLWEIWSTFSVTQTFLVLTIWAKLDSSVRSSETLGTYWKKKQTEISLHLSVWEASQNTRLGCDLTECNFSTLVILFSRFEYTRQILQFYVIVYAQDFSPGWFV